MYLGIIKRDTKIKTFNLDNTYTDYCGGLFDNMKLAKAYCVMNNNNSYISKSWTILLNIFMCVRLFFKSFLWIYHVKSHIKGDIKITETVDRTPEGIEIERNSNTDITENIKRVTYYIFRIIPVFHFRTGLTDEEIENLTK
jgi:hypothetical protein